MKETKLCGCGCCKLTKPGNNFIIGHNTKGKKLSSDHKQKISNATKHSWENPLKRKQRIDNIKKSKNTKEGKIKILKAGILGGEAIKKKLKEDKNFSDYMKSVCKKAGIKSWSDIESKNYLLKVRKTQWTLQAKNNMSNSTKKRFLNSEERERMRQIVLNRFKKPGERERQSKLIAQAHIDGKLNNKGRYKTGYIQTETYGKIFYQSSYEERFIKILEFFFKGKWKRCNLKFKYFDGKSFKYYVPDYICFKNIFFEVKGWFSEKDKNKVTEAAEKNNILVYLIFEKDLKILENLINNEIKEFPYSIISSISKKK